MEAELGLEPRHSEMGCVHPKQCLNHYAKHLSLLSALSPFTPPTNPFIILKIAYTLTYPSLL